MKLSPVANVFLRRLFLLAAILPALTLTARGVEEGRSGMNRPNSERQGGAGGYSNRNPYEHNNGNRYDAERAYMNHGVAPGAYGGYGRYGGYNNGGSSGSAGPAVIDPQSQPGMGDDSDSLYHSYQNGPPQ